MKFNTEIENQLFALAVDEVKGVKVEGVTDRNQVMREKFASILGCEVADLKRIDPMDLEEHKHKVFRLIREVVQETLTNDGAEIASFYNQFVEESTIERGDKKVYEVGNDAYLTVGRISGNNWDLERQRIDEGAEFEIKTDAFYIKVYDYFLKFLSGRSSFVELVNKVAESVKKHKEDFITDKFAKAIEGIPALYKYTGSYNEAQILNKIAHVAASNKGAAISLVGTQAALAKLQNIDVNALSDKQKEEYNQNGFIGKFKGYNCIALPAVYKANTTEFAFDDSQIYIIPSVDNKPVKIVNEGEVLVKEINDGTSNMDMTMEYAIIWKMGGAVIFSRAMGSIEITG